MSVPDRVQQSLLDVLAVAVPQARAAELTLDPAAALVPAASLGVAGFLAALVTGGALVDGQ